MDVKAIFTPEVLEAAGALIVAIVAAFRPELRESFNGLMVALVLVVGTLIGSQTAHRISIRQQETAIQVARTQAAAAEGRFTGKG